MVRTGARRVVITPLRIGIINDVRDHSFPLESVTLISTAVSNPSGDRNIQSETGAISIPGMSMTGRGLLNEISSKGCIASPVVISNEPEMAEVYLNVVVKVSPAALSAAVALRNCE